MSREPGSVWRKRRGGKEYGSYYAYAGGRIVNLATSALNEAREKAKQILGGGSVENGGASSPWGASSQSVTPNPPPASTPPAAGASVLGAWAQRPANGAAPPSAPTPAPSIGPALSGAMEGLAEGFATGVARFNAMAVALGVKHFAHVQPAKLDPDDLAALEKTWATGIKELMLLGGLKWWHVLLAQNGAMALNMAQGGTPIPPKVVAPVVAADAST